jgi:serine protease Do
MRFIIKTVLRLILLALIAFMGFKLYRYHQEQELFSLLLGKFQQELDLVKKPTSSLDAVEGQQAQRWCDLQTKARDTVVQIFSQITEFDWLEPYRTPKQFQATGSGFFINQKGDIITNAHVVDQARSVSIQIPSLGKRRFDVMVIGVSPERDLALLRLVPDEHKALMETLGYIPMLQLGDSDTVHRADEIMALGYPLGQSLKSTTGVVSGREHMAGQHMIQIDAPINPGSSGGPSLNARGEVIGVNSAGIREAQNVGYIIPSNEVKLFLRQLDQLGESNQVKLLRKPFLGILYNNASDTLTSFLKNPQPGGLYVVDSYKGSPLEKAGVLPGDMIYEIDGHKLDIFGELNVLWSEDKISIIDYVSRLMLGDQVHLVIYRNGERKDFKFVFQISELAPVRRMFPGFELIDYEVIGGMVVMHLALNHLPFLIQAAPELARYTELKHQLENALVVTHILPDSAAARGRTIGIGAVIREINGTPVKTLEEFRQALKKSLETNYLTVKTSESVFGVFDLQKVLDKEKQLSQTYFYPLSSTVRELIEKSHENKKAT